MMRPASRGMHAALALACAVLATVGCAPRGALFGARRVTPPPIGPPAAAVTMPRVVERVLANGLTVLVSEYHALPIMRFHLLLPGGAAYDPPGKEGVAELTAALLDQGTTRRGAEELAREVEFLGGRIGAEAGTDFSTVAGEFLSKDFDAGLELFSDVVLHPAFRVDELQRAQGLMLAGIVSGRDNPASVAEVCYARWLYGAHPYGHLSRGAEESVRRLDRSDAQGFYARHYVPDHAILVVIGDAPTADILAGVERAFGAWKRGGAAVDAPAAPARVSGRRILLVDKPDATQAHLRIGNVAIARTDPSYVAATVTSTILGGGFGARLVEELRVKRSLTYGAWSGFAARKAPGDFRVGTFTKVETTGEALQVALDVLDGFAAKGATAEELARAQSLMTGQFPKQLETPGAVAGKLAELAGFGLPRSDLEAYPARVNATSLADVADLARRWTPTADAAIVVVGPADRIAPQLAKFGTVERTTPAGCEGPRAPTAAGR
ncbi:MAG: insulinase family protein [Deltaproteobacteria bacterium]|nr:insulinase family protein [Deltaproteobacteria bacterium]